MSSDLQHRLYNYEVNPPASAWDKITVLLDDSHVADPFRSTIYNAEVVPPAGAWQAIEAGLDESQLIPQYPSTLYNMEVAPPAMAWDKIKVSLEEEHKPMARVRRITPIVRYAAAAAVIAAIVFGASRILSSNGKVEEGIAQQHSTVSPDSASPTNSDKSATEPALQTDEERDNAALEESKQTYASLDASDRERMNAAGNDYSYMNNESGVYFSAPASPLTYVAAIAPENTYRDLACNEVSTPVFADGSIDMATRYVLLMTPDGQIIRVSKKLGDLACCVTGAEQDEQCKDQLKKWRRKLADSPVANSPIDILAILQTLDNN